MSSPAQMSSHASLSRLHPPSPRHRASDHHVATKSPRSARIVTREEEEGDEGDDETALRYLSRQEKRSRDLAEEQELYQDANDEDGDDDDDNEDEESVQAEEAATERDDEATEAEIAALQKRTPRSPKAGKAAVEDDYDDNLFSQSTSSSSSFAPSPPSYNGMLWKLGHNNEWQPRYFSLQFATFQYAKDVKSYAAGAGVTAIELDGMDVRMLKQGELPTNAPSTASSSSSVTGILSSGLGMAGSLLNSATKFPFQMMDSDKETFMKQGKGCIIELYASASSAASSSPSRRTSLQLQSDDVQIAQHWLEVLKANIDYLRAPIPRNEPHHRRAASSTISASALAVPSSALDHDMHQRRTEQLRRARELTADDLSLPMLASAELRKRQSGPLTRAASWRTGASEPALRLCSPANDSSSSLYPSWSLLEDQRMISMSSFCLHSDANVGMMGSNVASDIADGVLQAVEFDASAHKMKPFKRFASLRIAWRTHSQRLRRQGGGAAAEDTELKETEAVYRGACRGEISSLDWRDDRLLASSSGGVVALFQPAEPEGGLNQLARASPRAFYRHRPPPDAPASSSSRVRAVVLNPRDQQTFLSIAHSTFALWSLERERNPLYVSSLSSSSPSSEASSSFSSAVTCCAWLPAQAACFAIGCEDGSLLAIDGRQLRSTSSVLSFNHAFSSLQSYATVTALAFNPSVPHLAAVGSSSGLISLFDIRMTRQALRSCQAHGASVSSLAWSPSNVELLVSGSHDGLVQLYSMRAAPHFLLHRWPHFQQPLLFTGFSLEHPAQIVAASSAGEVRLLELSNEALEALVPHHSYAPGEIASNETPWSAASDPTATRKQAWMVEEERLIERALYVRDLESAYGHVAALAYRYWRCGQLKWAEQWLRLLEPKRFQALAADKQRCITNSNFTAHLTELSRFVAPHSLTRSRSDALTERVLFLSARLRVARALESGSASALLKLEKTICSLFDASSIPAPPEVSLSIPATAQPLLASFALVSDTIDSDTLQKIVAVIARENAVTGIEFAMRAARALMAIKMWPVFAGSARFLFQSAFVASSSSSAATTQLSLANNDSDDEDATPVSRKAPASSARKHGYSELLAQCLRDDARVLAQLELLLKALAAVHEVAPAFNYYGAQDPGAFSSCSALTPALGKRILALLPPPEELVAVPLLLLRVASLHAAKSFDNAISGASVLAAIAPDSPCAWSMRVSVEALTVPVFSRFLERSEEPLDRCIAAALALASMLLTSPLTFDSARALASRFLPVLIGSLKRQWSEGDAAEARLACESILQTLSEMQSMRKNEETANQKLVDPLIALCQSYTR